MKALLIATAVLLVTVVPATAQTQLTPADIQRLQDSVYDASGDVSKLRDRDARLAESLQRELDDLRDEVIYLKVKLRKEARVPRAGFLCRVPRERRENQRDRNSGGHRIRRAAAVAAEFRHGPRRGSI